jgi:hypothetical protein
VSCYTLYLSFIWFFGGFIISPGERERIEEFLGKRERVNFEERRGQAHHFLVKAQSHRSKPM